MKLSVVIPVWNEEKTIKEVLSAVLQIPIPKEKEIIVVNDGSTDNSLDKIREFAQKQEITIIDNKENMGKSQSVKRGILASTGDLVVVQDADLETDPKELVEFVNIIDSGEADVVFGNRFHPKSSVPKNAHWVGNLFLSGFSAVFTGLRAGMWPRDMEVCYKMAPGDIMRKIAEKIKSTSRFGLEPEITARLSKYKVNGKHLKFRQVPISYFPRSVSEGKKIKFFSDGLKAIWEILRFNIA